MISELLEMVYKRCVPDENGCMRWTGAMQSAGRSPVIREGKTAISLRRRMLEMSFGRSLGPLIATYRCGNRECVKLEHLGAISRSKLQMRNQTEMDAGQRARKSHRIGVKARARAKLSIEIVREIRDADEPQREIARRFGVSQSTVCSVRRGATWRDLSNPFSRGAA
jgi:predicted XRE-type DNA-binding protein